MSEELSKKNKEWQKEFEHVKKVFHDAKVFEVNADYEVFHAIVDGVRMIFYPHTVSSTKNQHLRVRNGSPNLKEKFLELAAILSYSKQPGSTFSVKNYWDNSLKSIKNLKKSNKYPTYLESAEIARAETDLW